ncbi:hypothetical protein AeMF1_006297 [Aphanomyces euteiches]|nr:hypothetical protein AeMF1_006297 [Aphanomyces euteiches]
MERYFRYEAAGDQYTGRVAAGLSVNSSDFSILPPHFPDPDDPILVGALKMSFPTLHNISHLGGVLRLILASLVYHFDYLTTMLPASHPLLSTPLFVNDSVRVYLQSVLQSGLDSKFLRASGVPPHVEVYKKLDRMDRSILSLPRQIVDKISALLEETGAIGGHITRSFLETVVKNAVQSLTGITTPLTGPSQQNSQTESTNHQFQIYSWGSGIHLLPETFQFPSVDICTAWKLWWRGNPQQGLIPFKQIKTIDLSSRNQRNIYYEWKFTMEILCQYYSSKTGKPLLKNPSELQLVDAFDIVKHAVDHFRDETSKKRKRRDCQLKITTVARLFREHAPQQNQSPQS